MQHYFYNQQLKMGQDFSLPDDVAYHFTHVLRNGVGDQLEVVDGSETLFIAEISEINGKRVQAKIIRQLEKNVELPVKTAIVSGLAKKNKPKLIVQKATELGVNEVFFVPMERSIVNWTGKSEKKLIRLNEVAKSAAEQSHRNHVPVVKYANSLTDIPFDDYSAGVIAYEESAKQGEESNLVQLYSHLADGDSVIAVFGPEGGISEQEVSVLSDEGLIKAGLGPRIMRTETAPLYFLAATSMYFELGSK
ncbi:16S rRNA (uracil(1498)-N(3))-methyltransferase [Lentilactobacillus sp. Marseille-Q4993]|uniref:RsmE family RNA methyltransferase n=1 Tax=Lentilactobacillus sp. Marseille-Q4993 TaxID=3039492 RepID=UPI0024BC2E4D|nr:16S rRNA (uracil(1498)-N(3))-methyltransferase [Lentilactobacillus sp. Marseille-Q4993]